MVSSEDLDGERSSMFYEMMRIVDECPSISVVFLENVPNILKCGMKEVVEELIQRGFNFQWTTRSAGSMGAPHVRNRWFCLACKPGADLSHLVLETLPSSYIWDTEPVPRVILKTNQHPDWVQRCQTLGNAVVPCVVTSAFIELVKIFNSAHSFVECLGNFASSVSDLNYPYPETGMIFDNKYYPLPSKRTQQKTSRAPLAIIKGGLKPDGDDILLDNLPTHRRGISHASSLTERSLHDLPTVLVYSSRHQLDETVCNVEKLHTVATANVNYIEWMMGFPIDWTLVKSTKPAPLENEEAPLDESCPENAPAPKSQHRLNGMHIFMRDNPGKDIATIASMWRALTPEQKQGYTARARAM